MVKFMIKSIHIKGFKLSNKSVELTLAETQTSTVYGKNGCGKTTLLQIISAVFDRRENILKKNNVKEVVLLCQNSEKDIKLEVKQVEQNDGTLNYEYLGFDKFDESVLYITTDRGLNNYYRKKVTPEDIFEILKNFGEEYSLSIDSSMKDIYQFAEKMNMLKEESDIDKLFEKKNLLIDNITMATVENLILITNLNIEKKLWDIRNELISFLLLRVQDIVKKEDSENETITLEQCSALKNKIEKYQKTIESKILDESIGSVGILKDYFDEGLIVLNDIEKQNPKQLAKKEVYIDYIKKVIKLMEEQNDYLLRIDKIKLLFEEYVSNNKKIIITQKEVHIKIDSIEHKLNLLSNGERQLLTFLTVMSIIGRQKSVILIDEPGISLDTDWQEGFVSIMESLCPDSQIIYTTHSPDISLKDTNMICNLEVGK